MARAAKNRKTGQLSAGNESGGTESMAREHVVKVQLSGNELEQLDELRGGRPRSGYLRSLLHGPPEVKDVASYEEALAILTAMARDGKVAAAIALQRALHDAPQAPLKDELAELLEPAGGW
jgi:hypothetical protein